MPVTQGRLRWMSSFVLFSVVGCQSDGQSTQAPPITAPGPMTTTPGPGPGAPGPVTTPAMPMPTGPNADPAPGAPGPGLGPGPEGTAGQGPGPAPTMGPGDDDPSGPDQPGPAEPTVSEWRMMGYDLASTYYNAAETVLTKDNAAQLEIAYRVDMGNNVYGAPLQVGDVLYASAGGVVQALEADTGTRIWRNTRVSTTGSLAYEDGVLYAHTISSNLVALDATSGDQKWSTSAGPSRGDGSSSPIVAGDVVLVGGASGSSEVAGIGAFRGWLAAHDRATGSMTWSTYTVPMGSKGASLWSTVAVDRMAGRVIGGTGNNHGQPATDTSDAIVAFNLADGMMQWKNQRTSGDAWSGLSSNDPDADFGANPVLFEAMVDGAMTPLAAAGQKSGDAHVVRRADGMLVWSRSLCPGGLRDGRDGIFVNGAWSGRYLMFACNGGGKSQLFGLDAVTGNMVWTLPLGGEVYGRISSANGVGFVGAGKEMVIFDTDSGAKIKTIPSEGGTVAGTVTIANGRVAYGEGMSWANAAPGSTLTVLALP